MLVEICRLDIIKNMDKSYLLEEFTPNYEKLLAYGFKYNNTGYELQKTLLDTNFYFKIRISNHTFTIDVYDIFTDEQYILFNIQDSIGSYVGKIRAEANALITKILDACFYHTDIKKHITAYISHIFAVKPIYPFTRYPNYYTFKTKENDKWFALIMDVPAEKLKLGQKELLAIINLKARLERIQCLVNNTTILPAYHMHKKSWITIVLNKNTNIQQLQNLIVESYALANSTKRNIKSKEDI